MKQIKNSAQMKKKNTNQTTKLAFNNTFSFLFLRAINILRKSKKSSGVCRGDLVTFNTLLPLLSISISNLSFGGIIKKSQNFDLSNKLILAVLIIKIKVTS